MYIVCNSSGEEIEFHKNVEDACRRMRLIPAAYEVVEATTGRRMAQKDQSSPRLWVQLARGAA